MSAFANLNAPPFAADVAEGLSCANKHVAGHYLYDAIGASLFETVSMLPEYGMARAEERILRRHAPEMECLLAPVSLVAKLSTGCIRPAAHVVRCLSAQNPDLKFRPHYFSSQDTPAEKPLCAADWLEQAGRFTGDRASDKPLLLMLFGSRLGNMDRASLLSFLEDLRRLLKPGDFFLFGVDLIKEVDKTVSAYDDAAGVMAAFNKNLLARINRELGGHFNLRRFNHTVTWNAFRRRVELRLLSQEEQDVYIAALGRRFHFHAGETIQTEFAYKFSELEIEHWAELTGFTPVKTWTDIEWTFAESLWTV